MQLHELLNSVTVEIIVGPKEKRFHIHRKVLCQKSSYFKHLLEGGFKESTQSVLKLPEDDPDAVAAFLSYIYKDNLDDLDPTSLRTMTIAVRLYRFAAKICLAPLQNACLDYVFGSVQSIYGIPSLWLTAEHFENSMPSDKMRMLLVDIEVWFINNSAFKTMQDQLTCFSSTSNEVLVAVLVRSQEVDGSCKWETDFDEYGSLRDIDFYHVKGPST
ncbi:hypothetical protein MMC09_000868 [Bachmanniomyces sp. S44760]|nr:hypothetical protein [Bachmanniomyces sp. S44760]